VRMLMAKMEAAHAIGAARIDAVAATLRLELSHVEAEWQSEVAALEGELEAQWAFSELRARQVALTHADALFAAQLSAEAEVSVRAREHEAALRSKDEEIASLRRTLNQETSARGDFETRLAEVVATSEAAMGEKLKQAEAIKRMWRQKEEEADNLQREVTRLGQVLNECLEEGSLEALKRKAPGLAPSARIIGTAHKRLYEEACKLPVSLQSGEAAAEALSWRGTQHNFAKAGSDFHHAEWTLSEYETRPTAHAAYNSPGVASSVDATSAGQLTKMPVAEAPRSHRVSDGSTRKCLKEQPKIAFCVAYEHARQGGGAV